VTQTHRHPALSTDDPSYSIQLGGTVRVQLDDVVEHRRDLTHQRAPALLETDVEVAVSYRAQRGYERL
jgi:hypothetical protein